MACITHPVKTQGDQPLTNLYLVDLGMCFLSEGERSKMFTLKRSWPLLLLCVISWLSLAPLLVLFRTAGDVSVQVYWYLGVLCSEHLHHSSKFHSGVRAALLRTANLNGSNKEKCFGFCTNKQQYFLVFPLGSNTT